jgi:hypothetical protein
MTYSRLCVLSIVVPLLPLLGCTGQSTAEYSWTLPKTTLAITATYNFKDCKYDPVSQKVNITTGISTAIVANAVPDPNLGPAAPNGWVTVKTPDLVSFWQDKSVEVKTYSNSHLLQGISSTSTNQVGTIVGNVLTSAVKVAGIALGVPTAAGEKAPATTGCGTALATLAQIKKMQTQLKPLDPTGNQGKAIAAQILGLQNSIDITVTRTIDPGLTSVEPPPDANAPQRSSPAPVGADNRIALLKPSITQLEAAQWYDKGTMSTIAANPSENFPPDLNVNVYLNFVAANPVAAGQCSANQTSCTHSSVPLAEGAFYREVAFIPVEVYKGDAEGAENLISSQVIPFGQFGISRSLPLASPLFGKTDWSLSFNNNGEITDAAFGSAAIGVGATSLLNTEASSASSIAAESLKSTSLGSSATQKLLIENTNLQAAINNANYKQQYQALQAKGLVP